MKKFVLIVAVAAMALLADGQLASARRGGCGGGGRGGCGGCGGGYYGGGCGMGYGGCGMGYGGGCGMGYGGCGMGYGGCGMGYGGCGMMGGGCGMGYGGYGMGYGGYALSGIDGGAAYVQAAPNEGTLVVTLPEDATLTIDGEETTSTSANRVFITPALEQGKEYEYTLKARVVRDGQAQVATVKVTVRPGQTSQVELKVPAASVAAQ